MPEATAQERTTIPEWITVPELARMWHKGPQQIRGLIKENKLPGGYVIHSQTGETERLEYHIHYPTLIESTKINVSTEV